MTSTITELVLESGAPGTYDDVGTDFDLLRDAVIAAGLADALNDADASVTVFAPIDAAFVGTSQALGFAGDDEGGALVYLLDALALLGSGDPLGPLTSILTYHVVDGEVFEADLGPLGDGAEITTLLGATFELDLDTSPPSLIDADDGLPNPGIILTDIDASNGVIHALDGVLLPLSVTGLLSQPGTDFVIGTDADETFATRKGNDFVDGNGGDDVLNAGKGDDVVLGGSGNDIINGKQGDDILLGEGGKDKVRGGAGDDTVDGGAGDDLLAGGGGQDVFVFSEGYGKDTIITFRQGTDVMDLSGTGLDGFDALEDLIGGKGHRTKIDFGDGDMLILIGQSADDLEASDFLFA